MNNSNILLLEDHILPRNWTWKAFFFSNDRIYLFFPQVSSQQTLFSHLLECEIVLYNITEDADQIEEATWAASG